MIALALPIFLAAGWDLRGWPVGATLWVASRALASLLTHLQSGMGNLAGSGVVGFGMSFRALAVMVVVARSRQRTRLALAVTLLYALAYTLELAVSLRPTSPGRRREAAARARSDLWARRPAAGGSRRRPRARRRSSTPSTTSRSASGSRSTSARSVNKTVAYLDPRHGPDDRARPRPDARQDRLQERGRQEAGGRR